MLKRALHVAVVFVGCSVLAMCTGCAIPLANLSASLGGGTAGGRGTVRVLFINNTPFRAVFTYGTFDQTDQFSQPDFRQFGPSDAEPVLDGDRESSLDPADGASPLTCGRVFSIGGSELLRLIDANLPTATTIDDALVEGVVFLDTSADGEAATSAGFAPPFEALLGMDFPCESLLIVRLEHDDVGPDPFRVDFEVIPADSTR